MAIKFNPISANFDLVGDSGAGTNLIKSSVATEALLPASGEVDGQIIVVRSTNRVYVWSSADSKWHDSTFTVDTLGATPNSSGMTLSSTTNANGVSTFKLALQPADGTNPGTLTAGTQSIGGSKTFLSTITGNIDKPAGTLAIGASASTINIGNSSSTVTIQGTTIYQNVTNSEIKDAAITLNKNGLAGTASGSGIEFEEASSITGYVKTSTDRNSIILKAPGTAGIATLTPGATDDTVTLNAATQTLSNKTLSGSTNTITNISLSTAVTGTLPVANGGTGTSTGSITGTGSLTFAAGGTNQNVNLTPSGTGSTLINGVNVGIGATTFSPNIVGFGRALTIFSNGSTGSALELAMTGNAIGSEIGSLSFVLPANSSNREGAAVKGYIAGASSGLQGADLAFLTKPESAATAERMRITSTGNVGMGTTSPVTNLHVKNGGASGKTFSNNTGVVIENNGTDNLFFAFQVSTAGANNAFSITNSGNVGIGTATIQNIYGKNLALSGTTSGISFESTTVSKIFAIGAGGAYLNFYDKTANAERMRIDTSGNVGIGTTNPGQKLTVAGTIESTTGGIKFPDGTIQTSAVSGANQITGDIDPSSFSITNNQAVAADVTGLAFANASVRSARVDYSITINATASLYEAGTLLLIQKGAGWEMANMTVGDDTSIVLSVTSAGQVQYTSALYAGFTSGVMKFRALVNPV